ncbi:unnamed protein product, partial [Amoebophrya sp. A120]
SPQRRRSGSRPPAASVSKTTGLALLLLLTQQAAQLAGMKTQKKFLATSQPSQAETPSKSPSDLFGTTRTSGSLGAVPESAMGSGAAIMVSDGSDERERDAETTTGTSPLAPPHDATQDTKNRAPCAPAAHTVLEGRKREIELINEANEEEERHSCFDAAGTRIYGVGLPDNEQDRLRYLYSLLLDDLPDLEIDEVTRVVKGLFRVPIVLTTIIDEKRQWFKSNIGLSGSACGMTRQKSFCAHTLLSDVPEILYVPDARLDPRFKNNPIVQSDIEIRFYCGCPIIVEGVRLGALCVIDYVPRVDITYEAALLLCNFADIVAASLGRATVRDEKHLDMLRNACFLID